MLKLNNVIPRAIAALFSQVDDMINGSLQYAETAGVMHNPSDVLQAALGNARTKQNEWNNASTALSAAVAEHRMAENAVADFLANAKKSITAVMGRRYLPVMAEAGFERGSLKLPKNSDGRLYMVQKLIGFLAAHPECVDARATVNVTVAGAEAAYNRLEAARAAVNAAEMTAATAKAARDEAVDELRMHIIMLKAELRNALPPDSPVWYAFGLNAPADTLRPDPIPGTLEVRPLGVGVLALIWAGAVRATRYNVYAQVTGRDEEAVRVASVYDCTHTLIGLPTGQTVKLHVAAVNPAGEGQPTEAVEVVIP